MNARKLIFSLLKRCPQGSLKLTDEDGSVHFFGKKVDAPAEFKVNDKAVYKSLILSDEIGLGDSYMLGYWDSPDLVAVVRWFLQNYDHVNGSRLRFVQPFMASLTNVLENLRRYANKNTLKGSRRNIEAHYDLGNEFYEQFLDSSMAYSSAYFGKESNSLETAQAEKFERICRKLNLAPGMRILEIGCGWGGFALHAARNYGVHVKGLSLSPSQCAYAIQQVKNAGLESHIEIALEDYRHATGCYDRIVSIEMIEAVGYEYLPTYFEAIDRLLSPDGLAAIQVITSANQRHKSYRRESDWIRKRIFPGSHVPSVSSLFHTKPDELNLNLYHFETFGLHYARTLQQWRERFEANWPSIAEATGFNETFRRKWRYYLALCEASFQERHINVAQAVWGRSNCQSYTFEMQQPGEGSAKTASLKAI